MKCQLTTRTLDALAAIYKSFYWDIISFAESHETSVLLITGSGKEKTFKS